MPAHGNFVLDKGYAVTAAVTKFRAVKFTAEETVGAFTAATDKCAGVAQFSVATAEITKGKGASVRIDGMTELEMGDATAVAPGDWIEAMADGRGKKALAASGNRVLGLAVSGNGSGGVGTRISLRLNVDGPLVGAALP